jgi:hypothetical protein
VYHCLSRARRTTQPGWADKALPGVPKNGPGGREKMTFLGMHHGPSLINGILTKCYLPPLLVGPKVLEAPWMRSQRRQTGPHKQEQRFPEGDREARAGEEARGGQCSSRLAKCEADAPARGSGGDVS